MATPANPTAAGNPQPSQIQTTPNLVHFDPKACAPAQPIYLQRNDIIGLLLFSNLSGCSVRINYRFLTPEGEIKEGELDTAVFNGSAFRTFTLFEGWLLSFGIQQITSSSPGAWCYAQILIYRGVAAVAAANPDAVIWQGYVPWITSNGWPGVPSKEPGDGVGTLRSITGATPGAGAEISEVCPANRRWALLALRATLVSSVAVANRYPGFYIDDGTNVYYFVHTNAVQVASLSVSYNLTPGQPFYNDTQNNILLPLPTPFFLKAGFHIKTLTAGLQGTDQWSAPQYLVQEWYLWDQ